MLLENGDAALYWAKHSGRGQTRRYGARRRRGPRPSSGREIAALLRAAARARIRTVFQPIVELATGRAGGYEALARFDAEPRRGPDEWFAQAHRVGLGAELEALALRAALAVAGPPRGRLSSRSTSPRARCSPSRCATRCRTTSAGS